MKLFIFILVLAATNTFATELSVAGIFSDGMVLQQGIKVPVWGMGEAESSIIAKPVEVRYAWASNPEGANLYNKAGLPASLFKTIIKE
ncbi:hypothetical protein PQO03_16040 [Lentisphaera profundi]|uniref:Uncharacterized protein n=1 Tax=Lentisphaera profundi TaxID=1658616 RepID=A0ABY7VZ02_9BACT|nr:hypothetical protein [Lentisphaera profundi]WDE99347.1 hypothetical protein PQO03_16040 [Lentisphaera profundi]